MMTLDSLFDIINPRDPDGDKIQARLPGKLSNRLWTYTEVRWHNLKPAKQVLDNPLRIFWGLREHSQGGWCFSGRPPQIMVAENVWADLRNDYVFVVFLKENFELYDFRQERCDLSDPDAPENWADRFEELVWPTTS